MNDSQDLKELLMIVEKQQEMIALMEDLQSENEKLTRELKQCKEDLKLKKEELKASLALNENLNSESRKLLQQIESWNSLQT